MQEIRGLTHLHFIMNRRWCK